MTSACHISASLERRVAIVESAGVECEVGSSEITTSGRDDPSAQSISTTIN